MKKKIGRVLAYLLISVCIYPMASYGADEELIMLLKDKGILTQTEVDQLLARVKEKEKKSGALKAYYKDGFHVATPDNAFKMTIGGRAHMDYLGLDNNGREDSSFAIKRARINAAGTLFKNTEFKAEIDFGEGKDANLTDGYINLTHLPFARIMLGQYKEPFSLEQLTSFRFVDFVERSIIANNIAPGRDIGAMLHANLFNGMLGYGVGIFNGNGRNKKRDENDDKDVASRVYLRPFIKSGMPFLKGLQLGGAFTWGNQEGTPGNLVVPGSETGIVTWTKGVRNDSRRLRSGAELAWLLGPLSLKGEWMRTQWADLEFSGKRHDLDVAGWYGSVSWFLTGEKENLKEGVFGRVKPKHNFNPARGGWGALELAARYESLDVDQGIFKQGFATGTDRVNSFTLGANWYPHNMFRVSLNYVRNEFDDNLSDLKGDDQEDLILSRFQVDF
ncbi:MAG: hypothetical protein A3G93_12115 [Nitrospinae bacterium RIFCSPLOWO2_12_FULL_45_22]|nr:MAG: hypothetical protein A3G93_12115 [Nitrospinae bacterium RIFCSPLOWO2_12_FULL_45_22]